MKAPVLAGGLGARINEETQLKPDLIMVKMVIGWEPEVSTSDRITGIVECFVGQHLLKLFLIRD